MSIDRLPFFENRDSLVLHLLARFVIVRYSHHHALFHRQRVQYLVFLNHLDLSLVTAIFISHVNRYLKPQLTHPMPILLKLNPNFEVLILFQNVKCLIQSLSVKLVGLDIVNVDYHEGIEQFTDLPFIRNLDFHEGHFFFGLQKRGNVKSRTALFNRPFKLNYFPQKVNFDSKMFGNVVFSL